MIRGYIYQVRIFPELSPACRQRDRWRKDCNPDYDEVDVVETRLGQPIAASLLKKQRQRPR